MLVAAAALTYAGIDYVGYNASKGSRAWLRAYRIFQAVMQAALTLWLYLRAGTAGAAAFNLVWWTFGLDFLYYGFAAVVNPGRPWDSRGDLREWVFRHEVHWAYWTPLGMLRGMKRSAGLRGRVLLWQAIAGASAAATMLLLL